MNEQALLENTVLIALEVRKPGTRRKVNSEDIETDADRKMVHVSKTILECDELKAVKSYDREQLREYVKSFSLPSHFRDSLYPVPAAIVPAIGDELTKVRIPKRAELVEAFLAVYPAKQEEAREKLKSLYNPLDYPSVSKLRGAFSVEVDYIALGTPRVLQRIREDFFKAAQAEGQSKVRGMAEEICSTYREAAATLAEQMHLMLLPGEDGKRKRFNPDLIVKLQSFLSTFDTMNVVQDGELSAVVDEMRKLLAGVDDAALRKSDSSRERIGEGFKALGAILENNLQAVPKRKFRFDLDKEETAEQSTEQEAA